MPLKIAIAMAVLHDPVKTAASLSSLISLYPQIRIHCTVPDDYSDNRELLQKLALAGDTVTYTPVKKNPTYAALCNIGIAELLEDGYRSILLCHSGIYFSNETSLYDLEKTSRNTRAAIIGPRILDGNGVECNLILDTRPSETMARLFFARFGGLTSLVLPSSVASCLPVPVRNRSDESAYNQDLPQEVYALNSSCILLCPPFLDKLQDIGMDNVPLHEGLVLAEIAARYWLHTWLEPAAQVIEETPRPEFSKAQRGHFKSRLRISVTAWYKKHYLVVNKLRCVLSKYSSKSREP